MKRLIKKFKGSGDKKVLILSGIHGNELTPIAVSSEIINQMKMENYFPSVGELTIINGFSEKAIKKGVRANTFDPNREIESRKELSGLKKLILSHDITIDLHSSPNCSEFISIDDDEYTNKILNWTKASKVPYIVRSFGESTIKNFALKSGKIGVTMEMPGLNLINWKSVGNVINYIIKLLSNLSALDDPHQNKKILLVEEFQAEQEGIFIFTKRLGDFIEKDTELAKIVDYENNVLSTIKNTSAGFLLVGPTRSFVNKGEYILMFQPLID